jgi:hypothetical protein
VRDDLRHRAPCPVLSVAWFRYSVHVSCAPRSGAVKTRPATRGHDGTKTNRCAGVARHRPRRARSLAALQSRRWHRRCRHPWAPGITRHGNNPEPPADRPPRPPAVVDAALTLPVLDRYWKGEPLDSRKRDRQRGRRSSMRHARLALFAVVMLTGQLRTPTAPRISAAMAPSTSRISVSCSHGGTSATAVTSMGMATPTSAISGAARGARQ